MGVGGRGANKRRRMEKEKYRALTSYLIARPARLSPFRFVVPALAPMPSLEEVNLR